MRNVKDKIGFIAVGQAGGNIGSLFEKKGFPVLYLNTSQEDLDTIQGKNKYHIKNGEGAAKKRDKAKRLVVNDFQNIFAEINSKIDADLIYIIFSSGGGTGSGSSPMLAELLLGQNDGSEIDKHVGMITIIPAKDDTVKANINSYDCFAEISELEGLSSCFILDNEGKNKLELNSLFVDAFTSFVSIPSRHQNVGGNLDMSEVLETLYTPGNTIIVSATDSGNLLQKIDDNIFAPIEKDKAVVYISASLSGNVKMSDIQKKVGIPYDSFETKNKDKSICCISGLSFPTSRFDEILQVVDNCKGTISQNVGSAGTFKMKKDTIDISLQSKRKMSRLSIDPMENKKEKKISSEEIMAKYFK